MFCHFLNGNEERSIGFADLFRQAAHFCERYRRLGLAPGGLVLIATDFAPEGMFAFIGAMLGGYLPAFVAPATEKQDPARSRAVTAALIRGTRPAAIVMSPGGWSLAERLDGLEVPVLVASPRPEQGLGGAGDELAWHEPAPEAVAFLQFSSGTTGLRKGVPLTHRAVLAQLDSLERRLALQGGDVIASWLPLYHDMGLIACFVLPLVLGLRVTMQDPVRWSREPGRLFAAIARHRATHAWLPNFAFNHLRLSVRTDERYDLSSMKAFINCSEPCRADSLDRFEERFAPWGVTAGMLATSYALAEAVFAVTQSQPGVPPARLRVDGECLRRGGRLTPAPDHQGPQLLSCGRPLPGIELAVLDPAGRPLPPGSVGEIGLAGDFVFEGYRGTPADRGPARRGPWFMTGDLGALVDGELYVTGRCKDIIIVNGRNFYAHDIEDCLGEVAGVKPGRAVAVGLANEVTGSEEVVVLAETDWSPDRHGELAAVIRRTIRQTLGLTAVRARLLPLRSLIKTTSGKLAREENRARHLLGVPADSGLPAEVAR